MPPKIHRSKDCGHSPKQKLLENFAVAIACADAKTVEQLTSADAVWQRPGRKPVAGQPAVIKEVGKLKPVSELQIESVVSHGRKGAVAGSFTTDGKTRAFSHFMEFTNTKCTQIAELRSLSMADKMPDKSA